MSDTISIQAILKKHNLKDIAKRFEHVARMGDIDDRLKAAIKEIAEAIVDKCAEMAETINDDKVNSVKTMIKYE